jgi:hypothetical protein
VKIFPGADLTSASPMRPPPNRPHQALRESGLLEQHPIRSPIIGVSWA